MGREVRKVPANWVHPVDQDGRLIPMFEGGGFEAVEADWNEGYAQWQAGLCSNYTESEGRWMAIPDEYRNMRYSDYSGSRPSPDDYMPNWPDEQRTHLMMYEDTSEGTPISPAFETPEELARWLTDNKASAFGSDTASYEGWLRVCGGGYAPSCVIADGVMTNGVDAL